MSEVEKMECQVKSPIEPHEVIVRWGSETEEGGVFRLKGVRVTLDTVLAVFDGNIELHVVLPTDDPAEFELVQCFSPMFRVGEDESEWGTILSDLTTLNVVSFAKKYPHAEYLEFMRG